MAGWHHWLDGCESEWTLGVGDGQGGLASQRVGHGWATELNWTGELESSSTSAHSSLLKISVIIFIHFRVPHNFFWYSQWPCITQRPYIISLTSLYWLYKRITNISGDRNIEDMQRGKRKPDETISVGGMSEEGGPKKPSWVPISVSLFSTPCFHFSLFILEVQYSSPTKQRSVNRENS